MKLYLPVEELHRLPFLHVVIHPQPRTPHFHADDAGVSYDTLWAWKVGRRNPSPGNLARLAEALERRGGDLTALAEELRKAAEELET